MKKYQTRISEFIFIFLRAGQLTVLYKLCHCWRRLFYCAIHLRTDESYTIVRDKQVLIFFCYFLSYCNWILLRPFIYDKLTRFKFAFFLNNFFVFRIIIIIIGWRWQPFVLYVPYRSETIRVTNNTLNP